MDTGLTTTDTKQRNIAIENNPLSGSEIYQSIKYAVAPPTDLTDRSRDALESMRDALTSSQRATGNLLSSLFPFMGKESAAALFEPAKATVALFSGMWSAIDPRNFDGEWLHSQAQAQQMIDLGMSLPPDNPEVEKKLNRHFFTHNLDGTLNRAQENELQVLFAEHEPEHWPNLVLTSSHALVRGSDDVSGIMQGFHALITHAFGDGNGARAKDLPLIRDAAHPEQGETTDEGKKTLIVSSVFNHRNALVNGGELILRLRHLDDLYEHPPATQQALEKAYIGDEKAHDSMSPASVRLGKLMLSLIVQQPEKIDLNARALTESAEPIRLREDAGAVLQHIKLAGYSKGGSIVTDAVRYLILELQHADAQGKRTFDAPQKYDPSADPNHAYAPISDKAITGLMHNIGLLCVNPGITPLTERERSLGMRRLTIRNKLDRISAHMFRKHDREGTFGMHDDVYVISGKSSGDLGHSPEGSLGTKDKAGYLIDESLTRPEDLPTLQEIKGRLRSFFASCYNKVGISHVHFDPHQLGDQLEARIEFSTGVSEVDVFGSGPGGARINIIRDALEKAGLSHVSWEWDMGDTSQCFVRFHAPHDGKPVDRLKQAFESVNQSEEIFVSPTTLKQLAKQRQITNAKPERLLPAYEKGVA